MGEKQSDGEKVSGYECGFDAFESSRVPFFCAILSCWAFCLCCLILKFLFYSLDLLFLIGSASGDLGGSLFFCLFWWRAWFTSGLKRELFE